MPLRFIARYYYARVDQFSSDRLEDTEYALAAELIDTTKFALLKIINALKRRPCEWCVT